VTRRASRIVVTGSVAFDHVMRFDGRLTDHLLPHKIDVLNVSFMVESSLTTKGGAGANIAYNLVLLGHRPVPLATVGADVGDYLAWMRENGIETESLRIVPSERTARCFIMTDDHNSQIMMFDPGAMRYSAGLSIDDIGGEIDLVVIAPDEPQAMLRHVRESKHLGIPYVFNPGQQVIQFDGPPLVESIDGCRAFVANEYELAIVEDRAAVTAPELATLCPAVVVTYGEGGSSLYTADGVTETPALRPRDLVDPTGAGDAYLAGIVDGVVVGGPLERALRVGTLAATYALEAHGTQGHTYSLEEFDARFEDVFAAQATGTAGDWEEDA
jgi:adenosine kinase